MPIRGRKRKTRTLRSRLRRGSRFDLFLDLLGFFLGDALLEGFGSALDERLASARPRPATAARTSLMTAILLPPASLRTTSKAVFSSTGGAAAPAGAPAATATGAAGSPPFFFELFYQISDLQNSKRAELFHEVFVCLPFYLILGIVAPRSLRAFEADSRQPDKEPLLCCCPQRGFGRRGKCFFRRNGPIAVHLLLWLLACCFGFRLENARQAGRLVEDPHELGCRSKEQAKEVGLQDLF